MRKQPELRMGHGEQAGPGVRASCYKLRQNIVQDIIHLFFFSPGNCEESRGDSELQNPALHWLLGFEKKHQVVFSQLSASVVTLVKLYRPPSSECLPAVIGTVTFPFYRRGNRLRGQGLA